LDEAVRRYLAWESILAEKVALELAPQQVKQAENQLSAASGAITARLPETYQWLLVPTQSSPSAAIEWQAFRLSGQEQLAVRASKKLRSDELLLTGFAPTRLRMELDRVPLWRNDHVAINQLVEDFARYLYLPRLKNSSVLLGAVREGVGLLTWELDSFAFADSFDETTSRYRGLRGGQLIAQIDTDAQGILVKPDVARPQLEAERPIPTGEPASITPEGDESSTPAESDGIAGSHGAATTRPRRFHGTVLVDAARVGRDASRIADEVIAHLAGIVGASVKVTLEVEADIPSGAPDHVVRTVTENSRTLGFTSQGFEDE
jgi:hypothetical protein